MLSEFEDLSQDQGVMKKIISIDTSQDFVQLGDEIKLTFIGTLENGQIFDENSNVNEPFSFILGVDEIIEGWNIAIASMRIKEKALIKIQPKYAYKDKQIGKIPPNSILNFEIQIISAEKTDEKWDFSREERIQKYEELKKEGNSLFKNKQFPEALAKYKEAESWLQMGIDDQQVEQGLVNIYNNLAATYLSLENWSKTIQECDKVIQIHNNNLKALFRRGSARFYLGLYDDAKNDLQKSVMMEPNDQQIRKMFKFKPERIVIELFRNIVPITAENFLQLCKQKKFTKTPFHRLIRSFLIQGGDYMNKDGTGGKSIYGDNFKDENFKINHSQRGLLSMANSGPNSNGSQFFILFKQANWLDGKHVVFGLIKQNLEFLQKIQDVETDSEQPVEPIIIKDCAQL